MTLLRTVSERLSAWRRYREAIRELAQLSDSELHDIGIVRGDLPAADRTTPARAACAMAPLRGTLSK